MTEDELLVVSVVQILMFVAVFTSGACIALIIAGVFTLAKDEQGKHRKEVESLLTWSIILLVVSLFLIWALPEPAQIILKNHPPPPGPR